LENLNNATDDINKLETELDVRNNVLSNEMEMDIYMDMIYRFGKTISMYLILIFRKLIPLLDSFSLIPQED